MFSTSNLISRGLLVAGAIAFLGSAVIAQTAAPAAPAATATATPAPSTSATSTSTDKPMGALKATPAEKKAVHDKKAVDQTAQKTAGTKASTAVKKQAIDTKTVPAAQTTKPASGTPVTQ